MLAGIAAADRGDPVLRFVQAEAIEASGNAFFAGVTPVAEELGALTGVQYRYFAQYHLDRETGHIDTGNAFEDIVLDAGQRTEALRLFERVFDAMVAFVDACYEYALAYTGPGVLPRSGRDPGWGPNGRRCPGLPRRPWSSATSTPAWTRPGTSCWRAWPAGSSPGRHRSRPWTPIRWRPRRGASWRQYDTAIAPRAGIGDHYSNPDAVCQQLAARKLNGRSSIEAYARNAITSS